jgi:hypothetical protein
MFFRKFYNTDAPDAPSTPSVAELMAKHGQQAQSGFNTDSIPVINKESNEEPPAVKPPIEPVATTTSNEPPAQANQESLTTPEVVKVAETTPPIAETPTPVPTWQEVLRQQQPDTIFKELGLEADVVGLAKELTPEMKAFFNHWKANGDVTSYLRELSTDYSKMPAEDVMRHQLRQEYPKASDQQLNVLFRKEVVEKYNLNSEDETEKQEGVLLLEAKADKYRDDFAAKQKDFLLPPPPKPEVPEQQVDNRQQALEAYQAEFQNDAYTKNIFANKTVSIGEGDEKFNYPIEPEAIKELLFTDKWAENLSRIETGPDGSKIYKPDAEKQFLIGAFAANPKGFLTEYAKHFKAIGGKSALAPIENAKLPDASTPSASEAAPDSPAGAMARGGRLSW